MGVNRVSMKEVEAVWEMTTALVEDLGLLPDGARLELCKGDAYRFWQVALIPAGRSSHSDPRDGGLPQYLGDSKREVVQTLRGVIAALSAAKRRQDEVVKETIKRAEGPLL
jgi:hypothetical protein